MRRNLIRLAVFALLAPIAIFTTGCPQGSGEAISITPSTLDFGLTQNSLTFDVSNTGSFFTTAQFEAVAQSIPWVQSIDPSSGQSFALFGAGEAVTITVTINRANLAPGVISTGVIIVGPTSPESSATPQVLTVRATGEGVVEGEGEGVEGEGEGIVEGIIEGVIEGEGEEPIVCPEPCGISFCVSDGVDSGVQLALQELYDLPILGQDPNTADLDGNGILDIAHGNLLDIVLANTDLPIHCCVLSAWDTNEQLVLSALDEFEAAEGEGESILNSIGRDVLEPVFTGLATLGERRTQVVLQNIVNTLGIPLDPSSFDLSARMYLASDGDADLDGVCNLAEFRGAGGDPFGFILAAIDPEVTTDGGGCGLPCYVSGDGEGGGGEGSLEGAIEGDEEGVNPDRLCFVNLNQGQLPTPSGSAATGTAEFSSFEGQVLLVVNHNVPDPLSIGIYQGGPGDTGALFIALQSANSPSFILLSESQYNVIDDNHYIQVNSVSRPGGAIRANLQCSGVQEGEAEVEGTIDGEGTVEGEGEGVVEGTPEGEGEGGFFEGERPSDFHSADYALPLGRITLSELIRAIQFFNQSTGVKGAPLTGAYGCAQSGDLSDEGYVPGSSLRGCRPHDLDFAPQDWHITLTELLRLIQVYNFTDGSYYYCPGIGEDDDFCLGTAPVK
jgi:hypothetical protein